MLMEACYTTGILRRMLFYALHRVELSNFTQIAERFRNDYAWKADLEKTCCEYQGEFLDCYEPA